MTDVFLPDRTLIRITGSDAESFLQALVTTDVAGLAAGEARPGALLTPQGKILFDFLIWRDQADVVIETDIAQRDPLINRLTMYKLRAAVAMSADPQAGVTVSWDGDAEGITDSRFAKAGVRLVRRPGKHGEAAAGVYDALRITHGIVQSGDDYALQDAFPHDVLLDKNDGLSFRKGCYIGQEVVSRMQHRGTARRRAAIITAEQPLPPAGTELMAAGKPVGTLGSVAGLAGLAIVRTDRVGEAQAAGSAITAGDVTVAVSLPAWSGLSFPVPSGEAQA